MIVDLLGTCRTPEYKTSRGILALRWVAVLSKNSRGTCMEFLKQTVLSTLWMTQARKGGKRKGNGVHCRAFCRRSEAVQLPSPPRSDTKLVPVVRRLKEKNFPLSVPTTPSVVAASPRMYWEGAGGRFPRCHLPTGEADKQDVSRHGGRILL